MPLSPPVALSLFYVAFFAAFGAYLPYLNLYLEGIGLTGPQIGVISALLPLSVILFPAIGGILADRLGRRRGLIIGSSGLSFLTFASILGVRGFAGVATVVGAHAVLRAPILPLIDASAMEIADRGGPHYGRIRAWGSIAFIAVALATGGAVGLWGISTVPIVVVALLGLTFGASFLLPPDPVSPHPRNRSSNLAAHMKSPAVYLFLLVCVLSQAAHGPYYVFYSIHLERVGYAPTTIGLLWAVAILCEILVMLRMSRILDRFSTLPTMAFCLLLGAVRWGICSLSAEPLPLVAAQILHATTYAAFHVAAVTHIHRLFGEGHRSTAQAIYSSATYGVGNVLGMLLSGLLSESYTIPELFARAAWVALLGGVVVIGLTRRSGVVRPSSMFM